MGQAAATPDVKVDGAYRQLNTNEFRNQLQRVRGGPPLNPTAGQVSQIMENVYSKYPLPTRSQAEYLP